MDQVFWLLASQTCLEVVREVALVSLGSRDQVVNAILERNRMSDELETSMVVQGC